MHWSDSGRSLGGVRYSWRLLLFLAAGLLLTVLYTGEHLQELLLPQMLGDLGRKKRPLSDGDETPDFDNPDCNTFQDKAENNIQLLDRREHGKVYDKTDDAGVTSSDGSLKEEDDDIVIKAYSDSAEANQGGHLTLSKTTTLSNKQRQATFIPAQGSGEQSTATHKTVLFYTRFFSESWDEFLFDRKVMQKCPISDCTFIQNSSHPEDADAVIYHLVDFDDSSVPTTRRPEQVYVWMSLEAPRWNPVSVLEQLQQHFKSLDKLFRLRDEWTFGRQKFFNWTMTYHRASDLMQPYGALLPLTGEDDPIRPALLDKAGTAYKAYMKDLEGGVLLQGEKEPGKDWNTFFKRPKLVVWMVSNCETSSGREVYVKELREYIAVDVFGGCGKMKCSKKDMTACYTKVLQPTYKFYLAFENSMCDDYLTEKTWLPLMHGLVPVVYGGATYSDFLPPHSYIDATTLTPPQLARLLKRIGSSSEEYGRYHLWRKYWKAARRLPMCEICYKLHRVGHSSLDGRALQPQAYQDLKKWWWGINNCTTHYPQNLYPRNKYW